MMSTLSFLKKTLGKINRLFGFAAGIVVHQFNGFAVDTAFSVDLAHVHLQRFQLGITQEGCVTGNGEKSTGLDKCCLRESGLRSGRVVC